ncbi:hypothetical protein PX699_00115 [Sphingobium sp. H39-3-25]|uniref:hypothetical protein n=1 Tax=Sphingobium arseniciresistens TaxID=3030834 RepID=UPI0023B8D1B7|nr:hypothetical protein [Sphingobium arseniciresistens]
MSDTTFTDTSYSDDFADNLLTNLGDDPATIDLTIDPIAIARMVADCPADDWHDFGLDRPRAFDPADGYIDRRPSSSATVARRMLKLMNLDRGMDVQLDDDSKVFPHPVDDRLMSVRDFEAM